MHRVQCLHTHGVFLSCSFVELLFQIVPPTLKCLPSSVSADSRRAILDECQVSPESLSKKVLIERPSGTAAAPRSQRWALCGHDHSDTTRREKCAHLYANAD